MGFPVYRELKAASPFAIYLGVAYNNLCVDLCEKNSKISKIHTHFDKKVKPKNLLNTDDCVN